MTVVENWFRTPWICATDAEQLATSHPLVLRFSGRGLALRNDLAPTPLR